MNSIKLPNTLKTIKQDAFSYCDSLTEIEIPASVTNFNYRAIADCSDLQTITVNWQEPPLLTDYHFGKMDLELRTLIVPAGTKEIYEQAEVWNRFQIIEQLPDNIIAGTTPKSFSNRVCKKPRNSSSSKNVVITSGINPISR